MSRITGILLLLLLSLSACRRGAETPYAVSQSNLPDTVATARQFAETDTMPATNTPSLDSVPPEALPIRTTGAGPSYLPVTSQTVLPLDSLRREVAALRLLVARQDSMLQAHADTSTVKQRVEKATEDIRHIGLRVFGALMVLLLTYLFLRGVVWLLESWAEQSATRRLFFKKLIPITRLLVWMISIYYIIAVVFKIGEDQFVAAAAALGLALGFAAQDVLKNIFGGIIIILDQPFQVGDKINVGGTYGEVVSIGLRSTRITTPDDNLVTVPNAQIVDGQVSNANAGALDCQVVTDLYLPGWVDVQKAKSIAYQTATTSRYVYLDKPIVVLVKDEFKETFLTHLIVKAYVLDTRYEAVFSSDVTETAKTEFLQQGMLRPMPMRDVFPCKGNGHRGSNVEDET